MIFDETVLSSGDSNDWHSIVNSEVEVIDAQGGYLTPGMVETHSHGGNGYSLSRDLESFREIRKFQRKNGIARGVISLVTTELSETLEIIEAAKAYASEDEGFLGLHLEGPFLNESKKGAHNPHLLLNPDRDSLKKLVETGQTGSGNLVFSMTVAAELFQDSDLHYLVDSGMRLCLGHTESNYDQAVHFFGHHGKVMTHAFNAMPGIHHREPGPVVAAMHGENVYLELIADEVHVHPQVMKLIDPEKVILVTDSMSAAGLGDGEYQLGELKVSVIDSVARTESGALAGSTLLIHEAVRNFSKISSTRSALRAAITNPEMAYGLQSQRIEAGSRAELVLWDQSLKIRNLFNL